MQRTADPYPFKTLAPPLRFVIAVTTVIAVFVTCRAAGDTIDDGSEFLLLGTAVMGCAWFAGTGPALAATVLGALLGAFEASRSVGHDAAAPTHLALFVVHGLLLTAVMSEMRAARRSAEQQARVAQAARLLGEAANRMKDEFLATVSHELRTPLNAVLGWVHLLQTGKLDGPTAGRGLEAIQRNVRLQAKLTSDLLDASKALTGNLLLATHLTSLGDAVHQGINAIESAARAKSVVLNVSLPDTPMVVLGDPSRLRQIVWHLLANAVKFTPRGGLVNLTVDTHGDRARLVVSDSGRGIDPQFLPRVFDRFTQADGSPTRVVGGLGVGLALVRQLVELHGGEIDARNAESGPGAVFTAHFPLQSADLRVPPVQACEPFAPAIASAPLDDLRVLVLDRDRDGRELLQIVLEQRGAVVRTAESVAEALDALESWRPDLLVRDSGSPDQGSYVVIGRIPSLDAASGGRIPAAALTTFGHSDERMGQLLADVQCELPKPVEPVQLMLEMARLVGRERRRARR
jgi:signal transduction histidine kinase